jgi:lipopolysaccharide/colanic/teichoic acid biosynthesis glycosyltransferase
VQDSVDKLEYDLYYVKHRSPYLDLVIALKTLGVLLRASGR